MGMAVVDVLRYQHQRLIPAMELDTTVQLTCHPAQSFHPPLEAWFKLCPRRHGHPDTSQRRQGLHEACQDDLTVQTVIQALDEVAPEPGVGIGMDVHAHDDLRTAKLPEGMLDAIGNVGRQSHLGQESDIRGTGLLLQCLQQPQPLLTGL